MKISNDFAKYEQISLEKLTFMSKDKKVFYRGDQTAIEVCVQCLLTHSVRRDMVSPATNAQSFSGRPQRQGDTPGFLRYLNADQLLFHYR